MVLPDGCHYEAEAERQGGDNRTMGRKFGSVWLYKAHGFVSAPLANQTGFTGRFGYFVEALKTCLNTIVNSSWFDGTRSDCVQTRF